MIYNISDYELIKYYSYTTTVVDRLAEFEDDSWKSADKPRQWNPNRWLKKFFEDVRAKAYEISQDSKSRHRFEENKCCFKIRHIKSGSTMFIGLYDDKYILGLGCRQLFGRTFDFSTNVLSDTRGEDYSRDAEY